MNVGNLGYWAVLEHVMTWQGDAEILAEVEDNNGKLTKEVAGRIAGKYKVARTFHGVTKNGYEAIASAVNQIEIGDGQSLVRLVQAATEAIETIRKCGFTTNPSGVTKLLWFRNPNNWYMYDRQAARAVGAGLSSVQGMRAFFAILRDSGVDEVSNSIAALLREAQIQLRPERIIDKFLWLRGSPKIEKTLAKLKDKESALIAAHPAIRDVAAAMRGILPDDRFDPLRYAA